MRWIVVGLALLLPACLIARVDDGLEERPEQFVFTMVAGGGPGPEADAAIDGESVDANHVASVETPIGRFDIHTYTPEGEAPPVACTQMSSPGYAATGCGDGDPELAAGEVMYWGAGVVGEWLVVEIGAGQAVDSVVVTADDSTTYRSNVLSGRAIVVYPISRGASTIQGLDSSGAPVGDPVRVAFQD